MRYILEKSEYEIFTNTSGLNFWGNMGAGVLPIAKTTGRLLLSYRSKKVNEPHTWGIFGGAIDERDKDPKIAAERELKEETGYKGKFEIIPAFVYKMSSGIKDRPGFQYFNFIGLVDDEFQPKIDWETEKTKWMTLDELKKLEPKHFGLTSLLNNSMDIISKFAK